MNKQDFIIHITSGIQEQGLEFTADNVLKFVEDYITEDYRKVLLDTSEENVTARVKDVMKIITPELREIFED